MTLVAPPPTRPLGRYRETPCPRTGQACLICGHTIAKRSHSVQLTLFGDDPEEAWYAHLACFEGSPWEVSYRERYLRGGYQLADFDADALFFHEDYRAIVRSFSWDAALALVVSPPMPKHGAHVGGTPAPALQRAGELRGEPDPAAPSRLFDLLWLCGFRDRLLAAMPDLPPATWIFFALHDDRGFQLEAARLLAAPELVDALERLRKPRLGRADLDLVVGLGERSAAVREAVAAAIDRYELDRSYSVISDGFSELGLVRYAQVIYFLVSRPSASPVLSTLIATGAFPISDDGGDFTYTHAFYYRAAVLHFARGAPATIELLAAWLDALEDEVDYVPSGNPAGFVRDTKKIALEIVRANPRALQALRDLGSGS